jgi:glycosyltransferase involved in cell wall biosynthesis
MVRILDRLTVPYEVIVVSDGNTDETAVRARQVPCPHIRVLGYPENRGKGYALRYGTNAARGELVAFIDGDLDIHPVGIARFLDILRLKDVDAVVAAKSHPDSVVNYPRFRRLQSDTFRLIVRLMFGLNVSDTQTGLKLFRRQVLDECLPHVGTDGFAFDLELLVLANDAGFKVVEGPVDLDFHFTTTTGVRAVVDMLVHVVRIQRKRLRERYDHTWVANEPANAFFCPRPTVNGHSRREADAGGEVSSPGDRGSDDGASHTAAMEHEH